MDHNPNLRYEMADVRRWAFYNIGAFMVPFDTGDAHGPRLPKVTPSPEDLADVGLAQAWAGFVRWTLEDGDEVTHIERRVFSHGRHLAVTLRGANGVESRWVLDQTGDAYQTD